MAALAANRAGEPVVCGIGMPLHPKVQALLTAQRLSGAPPTHTLSPEQARAEMRAQVPAGVGSAGRRRARRRSQHPRAPPAPIPVRIYTPLGAGPFAGIVYFHGGGFVLGDLETHDPLCRQIAARTGAVVCAVDYRLAPEHPFPAPSRTPRRPRRAGFSPAAATLGADPRRLFVMGDSAGGTLATVTALRAARSPQPGLRGQILIYPITDHVDAGSAVLHRVRRGLWPDARGHALVPEALHRRSGRCHRPARLPAADADPARPAADVRR